MTPEQAKLRLEQHKARPLRERRDVAKRTMAKLISQNKRQGQVNEKA